MMDPSPRAAWRRLGIQPIKETPVDLDATCEETDCVRIRKSDVVDLAADLRRRTREAKGAWIPSVRAPKVGGEA